MCKVKYSPEMKEQKNMRLFSFIPIYSMQNKTLC